MHRSLEAKDNLVGAVRHLEESPDLIGIRVSFVHQASATISFLFLGLSPPKANNTVSFFVSFHRGATQFGILFLVSVARSTAHRIYHRGPWLSDVSHLSGAPSRFLARPGGGARRCRSDRRAQRFWS